MPWGTLDTRKIPEDALIAARRAWTAAAFQEHRTGLAVSAALRALFECRAPVDLIAMASRFPLDELVHVELCARMAMELGGGTEIRHDPDLLIVDPEAALPPLLRAADMIVRFFCVGEALSDVRLHVPRLGAPRARTRRTRARGQGGRPDHSCDSKAMGSRSEAALRRVRREGGGRARLDAIGRVPRAGAIRDGNTRAPAAARARDPHLGVSSYDYRSCRVKGTSFPSSS